MTSIRFSPAVRSSALALLLVAFSASTAAAAPPVPSIASITDAFGDPIEFTDTLSSALPATTAETLTVTAGSTTLEPGDSIVRYLWADVGVGPLGSTTTGTLTIPAHKLDVGLHTIRLTVITTNYPGGGDATELLSIVPSHEYCGRSLRNWRNNDPIYVSNDIEVTGGGPQLLIGTEGSDILFGEPIGSLGGGSDCIYGFGGADVLRGGPGNDEIHGGDGGDTIFGDADNDTIYGGNGADVINADSGHDTVYAGNGNDEIEGDSGDDTIYGDAGADLIRGRSGADVLVGGAGVDTIDADSGDDTILGGTGDDIINGEGNQDLVCGQEGNDDLDGDSADDVVDGAAGLDVCRGGGLLQFDQCWNCESTTGCDFVGTGVTLCPVCGNGVVQTGEQCDPPDGTDCSSECRTIHLLVVGNPDDPTRVDVEIDGVELRITGKTGLAGDVRDAINESQSLRELSISASLLGNDVRVEGATSATIMLTPIPVPTLAGWALLLLIAPLLLALARPRKRRPSTQS